MHEHSVTMGKHTATKSNLNAAIVLLVTLVLIWITYESFFDIPSRNCGTSKWQQQRPFWHPIESWSLWNMMPLRIPSRRTHRCRYCKLLRDTRAWLTVWVYLFRCAWLGSRIYHAHTLRRNLSVFLCYLPLLTKSLVKHNGSSQMEIKMDVIDVIALNSGIQVKDANETSWNRGNHQCQKRIRGLGMGPLGPLGSLQVACRICLAREGELLAPCPCRGSLRLAHLECLKKERWQKWLFDWSYLELERSKKR